MSDEHVRERRSHPRVSVEGEIVGRIQTLAAAPVLNLSEDGALLEVPSILRPGSIYVLRLAIAEGGATLDIRCRVVRSYVHGFQRRETGSSLVRYRAAVEFVEPGDEVRGVVRAHLERRRATRGEDPS